MTLQDGLPGHRAVPARQSLARRQIAAKPRSALILYGSETGNAQDVAQEIARLTERLRFDTVVIDLDSIDLRDLLKHTIIIVAISTTGQGEIPQNARSFWKILLSSQLRSGVLRRVNFTTFGLGDSSYPQYNVAHRMLHNRMLQLGAQLFCPRGEGNEQHPEGHNGEFRAWIVDLKQELLQHFPLPEGQDIIAEDVFLEPKWCLRISPDSTNGSSNNTPANGVSQETLTLDTPPANDILPIADSVIADLTVNTRLTPSDHGQDVRLLDFTLSSNIDYGPGAVAVVYPKNFPKDVNQFIECMGWQSMADTLLELVPTTDVSDLATYPPSPLRYLESTKRAFTIRELLTNYLDIVSIPRRTFFASLAYFTKEGNEEESYQKERVLELANPELIDELWDYTTRPRRTILEIMPEFPSVKIPWQYALNIIPVMRGRQFSIASGGSLKHLENGNTRVQLLVAIANPPNPIIKLRKRYGVCTRYIATLQAGQQLSLTIQPGYLNVSPDEVNSPVLLIGPGTGVAPMRSMIYERLEWARRSNSRKPSLLFFGCRNETADYFFRDEWQNLADQSLTVFPGFSRDQDKPRTYVQDLVRKEASLVYKTLKQDQGKVYICVNRLGSRGRSSRRIKKEWLDDYDYSASVITRDVSRFHNHVTIHPADNLGCNSVIARDSDTLKVNHCHYFAKPFTSLSASVVVGKHSGPLTKFGSCFLSVFTDANCKDNAFAPFNLHDASAHGRSHNLDDVERPVGTSHIAGHSVKWTCNQDSNTADVTKTKHTSEIDHDKEVALSTTLSPQSPSLSAVLSPLMSASAPPPRPTSSPTPRPRPLITTEHPDEDHLLKKDLLSLVVL
ncbi:NADPH dependent diflavin oxidoreductase-like protein 1 [Aureobasidium pullulans]|uniref:NADPH dependent diflavin oxidoreductase-like protein 1 n=1 Tax=Aureobasidium pullulans TaxID=5580 RepID=A0A4T0C240_AURPU|nr:NADPH dependent diflavin oxidoreductase-like protein 1 [Aureobasidium pullulans]